MDVRGEGGIPFLWKKGVDVIRGNQYRRSPINAGEYGVVVSCNVDDVCDGFLWMLLESCNRF